MHVKLAQAVKNHAKCNNSARTRHACVISIIPNDHKRQRKISDYLGWGEPERNKEWLLASLGFFWSKQMMMVTIQLCDYNYYLYSLNE